MKAREVTVGNYYEYKGYEINLSENDLFEIQHNLLLFLKPIELNEQWLIDLKGVKILGYSELMYSFKIHVNYTLWIEVNNNSFTARITQIHLDSSLFLTKIDFVHQLQDLHYDLCKKELKK